MQAIREIIEVKSNKFTFDLPNDFISKKVEIIILPYETKVQKKEKSESKTSVGAFRKYANPALQKLEKSAWKISLINKHENH